jgi:glycosyltransferase involved in cell wall biosynthesis
MRVGVYNSHLATLGGGEQHSLALVRWLRNRGHDVEVLARPGTTIEECETRLGIDLPGVRLVDLDPDMLGAESDASERSAGYELFVNATWASGITNHAPHGAMLVFFPLPVAALPDLGGVALAAWTATARYEPMGWIVNDHGLHEPEAGGAWSAGRASYQLRLSQAGRGAVRAHLGAGRPPQAPDAHAALHLDGEPLGEWSLPRDGTIEIIAPLPAAATTGHRHRLDIVSDRFNLATLGLGSDERDLGVFVSSVELDCGQHPDNLVDYAWHLRFLDSYDVVLANSAYTARWIARRWGQSTNVAVLPPAVRNVGPSPDEARNEIVVLGRFFEGSHRKHQLELAQAFARMCDDGVDGWSLRLLGGAAASDMGYVERVHDAVGDYPISVEVNVPRDRVDDALRRAAIAWSATGWHEDPDAHPERFEHFGIAVVEAMSAAAVPVVLDVGGPAELVRHGVDGLRWSALDGPGPATRDLIADPNRRRRMGRRATRAARAYTQARFDRAAARALGGLA